MGRPRKYSDELRRRAVEEVLDRGRKVSVVAGQLGITSAETLRRWVVQAEADRGLRQTPTTEELSEIKALRRGGRPAAHDRDLEGGHRFFRPGSQPSLAVRMAFVDAHRNRWPVAAMCSAIGLSARSYYAARVRAPSARAVRDETLKSQIRSLWDANYRCYGARRVWLALRREGVMVARCTVERLMVEQGLRGVQRGKKRFTTVADPGAVRPPDLVERRFVASRPNELWLADITYASTWDGWLYVSFILDCYSRMIVGWQIADHLRTELVLDALEMAIFRRDVTASLIHHSDAGCQYTSIRYSDRLFEYNIAASIGSVGDSYDNAMAEALNGTYKAELVRLHGPWRTRAELETATIGWIYWYNETRLHGEIGDLPPAEYEAVWYTNNQPVTAGAAT